MKDMPYGMFAGQAFDLKDCKGGAFRVYVDCASLIQTKTDKITVVAATATAGTDQVAQGPILSDLQLTKGDPNNPCGLQTDDSFWNQANGAPFADQCSAVVVCGYAVAYNGVPNQEQAQAINSACLTEIWNQNQRSKVVNNMMEHLWNKYKVYAYATQTLAATPAVPAVMVGYPDLHQVGCDCWYIVGRPEDKLRINIDHLDTSAWAPADTIQFEGFFKTVMLVQDLACTFPKGSAQLTPVAGQQAPQS